MRVQFRAGRNPLKHLDLGPLKVNQKWLQAVVSESMVQIRGRPEQRCMALWHCVLVHRRWQPFWARPAQLAERLMAPDAAEAWLQMRFGQNISFFWSSWGSGQLGMEPSLSLSKKKAGH